MNDLKNKEHSVNTKKDTEHKKSFIKRYKIIIIVALLMIALGSIAIFLYSNNLSEDEEMVAKVVKAYHDSLKNPDSMQIFEIRIYNNDENKMILMDTAGQNGLGGSTRNIVAYTNNIKYLGDDSKADTKITKYTNNSDEIAISRLIYETWYNNGKYIHLDKNEYVKINVDKILRNYKKIK